MRISTRWSKGRIFVLEAKEGFRAAWKLRKLVVRLAKAPNRVAVAGLGPCAMSY